MQDIIIEEPYKFVPPVYSDWWPKILHAYLYRYMRTSFGVQSVECRGADRFQESLSAGHSIILTPNHCRLSDPLVMGVLAKQVGCHLFAMASWHAFKKSWFSKFMLRRMGAFSVYREGNDRQALDTAIKMLETNQRPLVLFPEGALTRHNDLVGTLMEGPSFIARQAAKRLQKQSPARQVVIHPVAIRYAFVGDLQATIEPVLDRFEKRFTWQPQRQFSLVKRVSKIGDALLALKEVEYLGEVQTGDRYERAEALVRELLETLERDWDIRDPPEGIISRVKRIRSVLLPDMIAKNISQEERERRWRDLATCYYLQQISHYPRDYILREKNIPERIIETIERLEEDFTDRAHNYGPFHTVIQVGKAIPVSPKRQRDRHNGRDPIMAQVKTELQTMLNDIASERTPV